MQTHLSFLLPPFLYTLQLQNRLNPSFTDTVVKTHLREIARDRGGGVEVFLIDDFSESIGEGSRGSEGGVGWVGL